MDKCHSAIYQNNDIGTWFGLGYEEGPSRNREDSRPYGQGLLAAICYAERRRPVRRNCGRNHYMKDRTDLSPTHSSER